MNETIFVALLVLAVALVLVFIRRSGARRVGYGSEPPAAVRRERPRREQASADGSRAVESTGGARSRAVESMPAGAAQGPTGVALSPDDLAEVAHLLASRRKIEAIKLVREQTGMGLKEAKDFVERYENTGAQRPTGNPWGTRR